MEDLITVIINVYNREKFIAKCLESIINQTYKNLEILIINDGSTDNTLKICESYQDRRIKIITTENLGLSLSRNVGIENSNGSYLYFVDSDDFVEENVIEYLYNLCKENKVYFSTCNSLAIFDYDFCIESKKEEVNVINSLDMLKKVLLSQNMAGAMWNKLIKRELFDGIRFENRITNDIVVVYKIVLKAKEIAYSNQEKYYFLKHACAVTAKGYEKLDRTEDYYKAILERYKVIKKMYPNLLENDVGMLIGIMKLYIIDNKDVEKFLYEQNAIHYFKKIFSFKMLTDHIGIKEKVKLILFRVSPKLYKRLGNLYRHSKYEYKM